jgi:hypothetical protein
MAAIDIRVKERPHLKTPRLSSTDMRQVGALAVLELRKRIARHINTNDAPMKPYSPRGPIYVPIFGVGKITRFNKELGATEEVRRTKSSLGGVQGLSHADIRKMKARGIHIVSTPKRIARKYPRAAKLGKKQSRQIRRTGKSMRFPNYEAYKRALGKSGRRDLELSGSMLGSIGIVGVAANQVVLGFLRQDQEKKARGNQRIEEWFALSPSNQKVVFEFTANLMNQKWHDSMRRNPLDA